MTPNELRKQFQTALKAAGYYDGAIDGDFGIKTHAAIQALDLDVDDTTPVDERPNDLVHRVKASSFADRADIQGFRHCKDRGNSDEYCFNYGDDGKGFGGLTDCTDESKTYVALPRDEWLAKFGSVKASVGKPVDVTINGQTVRCILGDSMPSYANIKNGAGIDLAVGAQKAFNLNAPFMVTAVWKWGN